MQGSQERKRANLWGPRTHFGTNIPMKIEGEFSFLCCTAMAHAGNTKIWAKIISTRAPDAATKPTTSEKSSYSPSSQKLTLREQILETPVLVIWPNTPHEKDTWRQVRRVYRSLSFQQTSAETRKYRPCG